MASGPRSSDPPTQELMDQGLVQTARLTSTESPTHTSCPTADMSRPSATASCGPEERLRLLADEGSLQDHPVRGRPPSAWATKARPGDGVVGGSLRIAGRPVFCFAQDAASPADRSGAQHADTIVRIQRLARQARVPVIGFVESGGARMQEGLAALDGYARIFREHVAMSGQVPQISVITGTSAGGGCYSPALTDFVVMTEAASMFLTGPAVVREVTGEDVSARGARRPRGARAQRRLQLHRRRPTSMRSSSTASCWAISRQRAATPLPSAPAAEPAGPDPGARRADRRPRASTTCATAIDGHRRRRLVPGVVAGLGAATS